MNVGALRVWWVPQVPMKKFIVPVGTVKEAVLIMNTLADYDRFQYENNVKPDYCNVGGLEIVDADGDWVDWTHESEDGYWDDPEEFLNRNKS